MATTFPLSPEEQLMGSVGAVDNAPGPTKFSGYNLTQALQDGLEPSDIAQYMASQTGYKYEAAKRDGVTDEQIIAFLMGENAFTAGMKQFINAGGSSIKGLAQLGGQLNTERALAERQAADIAATNNRAADITGFVAGSILDPVALPAWAVAPLKGASLVSTMAMRTGAQGVVAGALEPRLTEEDSLVKNILFGGILGAGLGAGVGKLLQKVGSKASDVGDVTKATEDADLTKQASKTAIEDVAQAVDTNIPAYLRRTEGRGVEATVPTKGMDEATTKLIESKITQAEADIARAEERLYELGQAQPERQTAALFRGAPTEQTPAGMGLIERATGEAPQRQVASLFRPAQTVQPEVIREPVTQVPRLTDQQAYLNNIIETKRAEINNLRTALQRGQQPQSFPVAGERPLQAPTAEAIAARDARVAGVLERTQDQPKTEVVRAVEPEAAIAKQEPTTEAPTQAAPERVDFAEGRSALNLGFGKDSIGAARTPQELVYAGDVPYNTNAKKILDGYKPRKSTVAPVRDEEDTDILRKVVGASGEAGKRMRGLMKGPASFENFPARAAAAEQKMTKEAADLVDWALQNKSNEWSADQVAALAPQFYKSLDFLRNTFAEYNALRRAGKMTDELETEIMARSQMHLGMVTIFQGQRSKASAKMNALKYAKDAVMSGKRVEGYATPNAGCV